MKSCLHIGTQVLGSELGEVVFLGGEIGQRESGDAENEAEDGTESLWLPHP